MADAHHDHHHHGDAAPDPDDAAALVDASIAVLRERGERVTTPRRLVIEELATAPGHLSADDLLSRITDRSPGTIHLATVYRTLEALEHAGIAAHVHLPHGATTYHLVTSGDPTHLHLMCRGCDRLIDVAADTLDEVTEGLERSHGFRLDPHHVALTGWCRDCLSTR